MGEAKKEINEKSKKKDEKKINEKESIGKIVWEWTYSIVLALFFVILIKSFIFSTTIVKKVSMYPTLQENNVLIIDRLSQVRGRSLERGEIVVLEAPLNQVPEFDKNTGAMIAAYNENETTFTKVRKLFAKTLYVKRLIAVAGDHVKIDGDEVYINGKLQDEKYINSQKFATNNKYKLDFVVPENYIFCMGDNRDQSYDSRGFGVIPVERVEGRIVFRLFPFNEIGSVD